MKALVNIVSSDRKEGYNAAGKAKSDVDLTLTQLGYDRKNLVFRRDLPKYISLSRHIFDMLKLSYEIKSNNYEEVIIQYPGWGIGTRSISMLSKLLKSQPLTLLIHDIDSLRYFGQLSDRERRIMNRASKILVHTENMKKFLEDSGVITPTKVMELFDYYANGEVNPQEPSSPYSLVFAGNLKKSEFLQKIGESLSPHTLFLYGLEVDIRWPENIKYVGKFAPDDIDDIKGDWGLVWDGDSVETCSGMVGNYLQYNSSHKASLYIASGKPVIVWNKSALASIVKKYEIGITVDNLKEVPEKLNNVDSTRFNEIRKNVLHLSSRLRSGDFLEKTLS
ncbi:MAG: hypothetical protein K2H96_07175 [Muribaculaceae bacterium]|nr:hypothetical protein [Muribaculaceae bacterium]